MLINTTYIRKESIPGQELLLEITFNQKVTFLTGQPLSTIHPSSNLCVN